MVKFPTFELPKYILGNAAKAAQVISGSAAPSISIDDVVTLSSDPAATEKALNVRSLKLTLGPAQGTLALRSAVAGLYNNNTTLSHGISISADDVITANGTTVANLLVLQSLLGPGDHVISLYPTYPQLPALAASLVGDTGTSGNVSYWKLDAEKGWKPDFDELRGLIRPETKLIVLNSPNNPTGWHFSGEQQIEILEIAREKGVAVLVDEIFWPLFHSCREEVPVPSFVEHDGYSKVVVTGSMSKVWGMSGLRVGWIVTRDASLRDSLLNTRQYTVQSTSVVDEAIATEVLSERCRPVLLKRHLEYAEQDLALLDAFVDKNKDLVSWTRPRAGATAFVRFHSRSGESVDDVEFCQALLDRKGVLFSPGSLCFGGDSSGSVDFKGYVRVHVTLGPEMLKTALEKIDAFLDETYRAPS